MSTVQPTEADARRERVLRPLELDEASHDPIVDALVGAAAHVSGCGVAIASVFIGATQRMLAQQGLDTRQRASRHLTICAHTLLHAEPLVVRDCALDARFASHPAVDSLLPQRFYVGIPLRLDRVSVGVLAVADHQPRDADPVLVERLADLAAGIEHWLRDRRELLLTRGYERDLRRLAAQLPAIAYRAALDDTFSTLHVSPNLRALGYEREAWLASPGAWSRAVHPDDAVRVKREIDECLAASDEVRVDYRLQDASGRWRHIVDVARRVSPPDAAGPVLEGLMLEVAAPGDRYAGAQGTDPGEANDAAGAANDATGTANDAAGAANDAAGAANDTADAANATTASASNALALANNAAARRMAAAVHQATDSIFLVGLDNRIEDVNHAACLRSGFAEHELIGRDASLLQSPNTPPEVHRALREQIASGNTWKGFLFNRRKDGREYVDFATVTPVRDASGRITSFLAVAEDMADKQRIIGLELEAYRNQLESLVGLRTAELQRARGAAEAASAAKSAFLATMSHEIRTPMSGVIGIVDVLQRSSLTPYQKDLADTIAQSASALLGVIDGILDFSKIEAGRMDLARQPFDLAHLLDSVTDALHPMAAARGVDLRVFVDPALATQRVGDALRVRQIVTNLVGNAIKFSAGLDREGRVQVRAAPCADGGGLCLSVIDNGIGMTIETIERLFQPFAQAEQSTTRAYGGSGLGLVISSRLAQAMGGSIRVSSDPGVGSRFDVALPLDALASIQGAALASIQGEAGVSIQGAAASPPQAPSEAMPTHWPATRCLSGVTCCIALDDAELAADWRTYLEAAGARVRTHDAAQATIDLLIIGADKLSAHDSDAGIDTHASRQPIVCVQRGQRRAPRRLARGVVSLDVDGLRRDMLLHAVQLALGHAETPLQHPTDALGADLPTVPAALDDVPPAFDLARGRPLLVAEDNDVNRKVIAHQLRLLGVRADIVADGQEALERWRAAPQRYAMLLTDLHMPRLDGWDLARTIRNEAASTPHGTPERLPIIALTANALRVEPEQCRAAGMDDHLTKPIALGVLERCLGRWLARTTVSDGPIDGTTIDGTTIDGITIDDVTIDAASADDTTAPEPDFDDQAPARLLGNDPAFIDALREHVIADAERIQAAIDGAAQRGDWPALAHEAHGARSAARAVGAMALARALDALEHTARGSDTAAIAQALQRMRQALVRARNRLEQSRTSHEPKIMSDAAATNSAAAKAERATGAPNAPVPGARVLIVDDDPLQHRVLERQLRSLQAAPVECFASGPAVLERLRRIDSTGTLMLVDLHMPGMDGVELIRNLAHARYRGAIALVSGAETRVLDTAQRLAQAWRLRTVGQLDKPASRSALRELLDRWHGAIDAQQREPARRFSAVEVREAIASQQLVMRYQPQVDVLTQQMIGVEALVRWQHPEHGLLGPDNFVPVAEAHGLIDELTEAVLAQALAYSADWAAGFGEPLRMAVNVSMDNLARLDFPDRVIGHLQRHGVPPGSLVLEVTETRLMKDLRAPLDILARLRLRGVGLSVDDFGTGHSSLTQIRDLPFDELKVDRGFVHGGRSHGTLRAILTGSVEMTRQLGMHVVAEGVEDRDDWDFVKEAGCHAAQGWFIAQAMPGEALEGWLREWRRKVAGAGTASAA